VNARLNGPPSKDETEATLVSDLLVEGCEMFGNGNVGSDREHNWIGDNYANARDGLTGTVDGAATVITGSDPKLDAALRLWPARP
jgi:hypothetical protein